MPRLTRGAAGMEAPMFEEACKTAIAAHKVVNEHYNWVPALGVHSHPFVDNPSMLAIDS